VSVVADARATWSEGSHQAALMRIMGVGAVPMSWGGRGHGTAGRLVPSTCGGLGQSFCKGTSRWNYIAEGEQAKREHAH
jgi:hypothetical protein